MGWLKRVQRASLGVLFSAGLVLSGDAFAQGKMVVIEQAPEARPAKRPSKAAPVKKRRRRRRRGKRIDPNLAIATYPGFRMLPDGSAEVWVHLSKSVTLQARQAEGRVTFVLSDTYVRTWNNTHALVTTHFNTPISRVRLRRGKKGTSLLTLDLREKAALKARIVPGPRGTTYLRIAIPRASRNLVPAVRPVYRQRRSQRLRRD